jgi:hypothetical protein
LVVWQFLAMGAYQVVAVHKRAAKVTNLFF